MIDWIVGGLCAATGGFCLYVIADALVRMRQQVARALNQKRSLSNRTVRVRHLALQGVSLQIAANDNWLSICRPDAKARQAEQRS